MIAVIKRIIILSLVLPDFKTLGSFYGQNNLFTGSIPSLFTMRFFNVSNNILSGSIAPLLSSLISFSISNNNFTGPLPNIPYTLSVLSIGPGNQLSGHVALYNPSIVDLRDNLIYSVSIQFTNIHKQL